ncbi:hypothetical protein R3W88_026744 [Solanum pinnatisectum]|uniref:Uncharacterized protein n=1 Tax=Solanum pinnatisectum TaxID=50273 RepID=A0AAV9LHJ4_9SOLN|nr:hypothetical protein R3W88_026744 [Solanum pinnatisectum]
MTPSETVSPVKEDIEPVEETIMDDELNELREPAPDVPESSIQNLLRATSPQGAKGKMPENAPQGQMLHLSNAPKKRLKGGKLDLVQSLI